MSLATHCIPYNEDCTTCNPAPPEEPVPASVPTVSPQQCPNPHCDNGLIRGTPTGCAVCQRRLGCAIAMGALHGRCVALPGQSNVAVFGRFDVR